MKENRKAAMDKFTAIIMKEHGKKPLSKNEWNKLKSHYYDGDKDGNRIEYAGIILYTIEKKLRSAR